MADVLFVLHARVNPDDAAVERARRGLSEHGHDVEIFHRLAPAGHPGRFDGEWVPLEASLVEGKKLVVTFGGDGTFIHAARTALVTGVPVMGVNPGRLGFLAWVTLETAEAACTAWAEDRTEIAERATMVGRYDDGEYLAINEAALLKDPAANVIQLEVSVEGLEAGRVHPDAAAAAPPPGAQPYPATP